MQDNLNTPAQVTRAQVFLIETAFHSFQACGDIVYVYRGPLLHRTCLSTACPGCTEYLTNYTARKAGSYIIETAKHDRDVPYIKTNSCTKPAAR